MKNRNTEVDVIKGIAIILMVYGHTFPFARNFIYLFHMSVFCIASGFCYKEHVKDRKDFFLYLWKKMKRLYVSFFICNVIFLLLTNAFLNINIYSNNNNFLNEVGTTPYTQNLYNCIDVIVFFKRVLKILLLKWMPPINVASWFLPQLFFVILVHTVIMWMLRKKGVEVNNIFILIITFCMFVLAIYMSNNQGNSIGKVLKRFPAMYFAFLIGVIIKNRNNIVKKYSLYSLKIGITSFCVIFILSFTQKNELATGVICGKWYPICCVCGWCMLMSISKKIVYFCKKTTEIISYIGRNTVPIVFLHCLAFKIVTWVCIILEKKPTYMIASFPILFNANEMVKVLYAIVGVIVPLFVNYFFNEVCRKLLKRGALSA